MAKKQKVKEHQRYDPRINKKVKVGSYDRKSKEMKPFRKSTSPVKQLYGITSDVEKRQIYNYAFIDDNKRLDMVLFNIDPKSRKIIVEEYEKKEARVLDAFRKMIIERGKKDPKMLEELLSIDETALVLFDKEDQARIKLLQEIYKEEEK